jgi:hypothetical protein
LNLAPEKTYRRFLLGIASDEEQCFVEEAVLAGEADDFLLHNAEDELIDDYLLGSMTDEEKHGFSANFLSTEERRRKLAFAAGLIRYVRKQQAQELSINRKLARRGDIRTVFSWKYAALLAAAASVLLAVLAGFEQMQLRRQAQIASAARNELTRLQGELAAGNGEPSPLGKPFTPSLNSAQNEVGQMPALEFASSTRSIYPALLRVPKQAQFVRIDSKLPRPLAVKYREVVVTSSGEQLWEQEFPASILPATQQSTIVLPAPILQSGLYHLQIVSASAEGRFEMSEDYVFRVAKE